MPRGIGAVQQHPPINAILQKYQRSRSTKAMDEGLDVQGKLDLRIDDEQKMDFVVECFAPRSPEMKSLTDLARIQLAAQFQQTFATGQRSEDLRAETAGMDLVRNMRRLGPGRGIPAAHVISNKGKTNTVGKMTYTAMAPHMNPMFDSTAYSGLSYLL
jgi:hypothetical protein